MSATAELIEKYRTLAGREIHVGPWLQNVYTLTIEIEGKDKPACVAEQVMRVYP